MKRIESGAYLLFDGDCGVCSYLAGHAADMDQKHRFSIGPYQSFSEDELGRLGITYLKCSNRIYAITPKGRVY